MNVTFKGCVWEVWGRVRGYCWEMFGTCLGGLGLDVQRCLDSCREGFRGQATYKSPVKKLHTHIKPYSTTKLLFFLCVGGYAFNDF